MQSLVIEIVIAVLLLSLLWSMDRGRSDLRFRLWVVGWGLVTLRLVSLLWHPLSDVVILFREAHFAVLEVMAGVCFVLSDPLLSRSKQRMLRIGAIVTVPPLFTGALLLFMPDLRGLAISSIVIGHGLALGMVRRHVRLRKYRYYSLAGLHFVSAAFMLGAVSSHHPELALATIPAEVFLLNAILFARNYSIRNPGTVLAVTGFLLWALSSFLMIGLRHIGESDSLFPRALDLPQFLVAIGLTMIILQQDAAVSRELVREYELLFHKNPYPLWIYDLKTLRFLSANEASARVHGCTVEQLCRMKLTDVIHPDMLPTLVADLEKPAAHTHRSSLHLRKDGSAVPMNVTAYDIRFRGRAARIALAEDVTEREKMANQLMYQVQHDLLTGLPNRATFLKKLEELFDAANRERSGCAVIVVHVNRFERINEKYGHRVADLLLKEVAKILQSHLRTDDAIGRTGSREYTIAFQCAPNGEVIEARARRLLRMFDTPITVDGHRVETHVTMGLAVFPDDSDDASGLLRDAARAQALTRVGGAGKFIRLSRELGEKAQEESRVEGLIQRALLHNGFEVYYQPIMNTDGELHGFEALLRLHDGSGGMVGPNLFIPIAESTGTIIPVGMWVIKEVCRQLRVWQDTGLKAVPIAINASALQIVQPTFCEDLSACLTNHNIDPSLIHLELTESSVMPQGSLALDNMLKMSKDGIHFSIDDFGTGFSSLDRLHQLPVSILKIDRTFVMRMLEPDGTLPIVSTIISMAHSLNVHVVAEGVETEAQFHALYEMGCDQFQGYFFSRPLVAAAAADKLASPDELQAIVAPTLLALPKSLLPGTPSGATADPHY